MLQDLTCASAQPVVEQAYPGTGCRREQGNPGARSREWSGPVSDKTTAARDSATGLPNCEVLLFAATPSTRGQHQASERELYAALSEMPRVQRESLSGPPRRRPFTCARTPMRREPVPPCAVLLDFFGNVCSQPRQNSEQKAAPVRSTN